MVFAPSAGPTLRLTLASPAVRNLEHILRKAHDTIPLGGSWKMYPDGDTAGDAVQPDEEAPHGRSTTRGTS